VTGRISRVHISRNKERTYDIDYDVGSKAVNVREEYVRVLVRSGQSIENDPSLNNQKKTVKLIKGIRVHVKMSGNKQANKLASCYYPGLIIDVLSNGMYTVECEENLILENVVQNDIIVGLSSGQTVEAKRAENIVLYCTSVSWSCTGNTLAVAYGDAAIDGWCSNPGAVCVWNMFSRTPLIPAAPHYVLDSSAGVLTATFHPELPSILVLSC
jgi:hypothetical protein